ncbi:PRC-barrel domain-containing protein [Pseudoxanthobacter sp. M-2]|uniref:PRC-barrel domain-containing protein n=1 Tax=Pseudoxanthobacter sp. M-2 TaxID=3078754 RepID=UPI0038FC342B
MRVLLSAAVVLGLAAAPAVAQQDPAVPPAVQSDPAVPPVVLPSIPPIPTEPVVEEKPAGPNAGLVTEVADRAEMMIGKPLAAEDGEDVGTVVGVVRDPDGRLREIHADIGGGLFGFGAQRISLEPEVVTVTPDGEKLLARKSADALRERADGG